MMTKMVLKWKLVTEQTTSGNKYLKQVEMIIYTMGIMMVYTVKSKMLVVQLKPFMDESSTEKNIPHRSIKNTKNTVVLEDDD